MWDVDLPGRRSCYEAPPSGRRQDTLVIWLVVAVMAAGGQVAAQNVFNYLYRDSQLCQITIPGELTCNVTSEHKPSTLIQSTWKDLHKVTVIGASALTIREQCSNSSNWLNIIKSNKVTIANVRDDCVVRLDLQDSEVTEITSSIGLIKASNSKADLIRLDPVEQFDFRKAEIKKLSVRATDSQCTIRDSKIIDMEYVVLEGAFKFVAAKSDINHIKHLKYNSTHPDSSMSKVRVKTVMSEGLLVGRGMLTLKDVTIDSLASRAIIVKGKGQLMVMNSVITNTGLDGLVMEGGSVTFDNVTLGTQPNVGFKIEGASGGIKPFLLVVGGHSSGLKWVLIGIVVGLIVGFVLGGVLGFYILSRRKNATQKDDSQQMNLLKETPLVSLPPPPTPQPQDRGIQQVKSEDEVDDIDDYTDVAATSIPPPPNAVNLALNSPHPAPPTISPPLPTISPPPPTRLANNLPPPPRNRPPPPVRKESVLKPVRPDERDDLPAPPPPIDDDQDPYDEAGEIQQQYQQHGQQHGQPPTHSFLHTAGVSPPPAATNSPYSTTAALGHPAGQRVIAGRPWPPPQLPIKPPPPPAGTKPAGSSNTYSNDDEEEPVYETIEEF